MFFGKYLKELRLSKGFGLRRFAHAINESPLILSNIEHGRKQPPKNKEWLFTIIKILSLLNAEQLKLTGYWEKNNIVRSKNRPNYIPVFVSTVDGKPLSEKKYRSLCAYLNKHA